MPLSFAIVVGFVIALAGLALMLIGRFRRLAFALIGVGVVVALVTIVVIVLAVNSRM